MLCRCKNTYVIEEISRSSSLSLIIYEIKTGEKFSTVERQIPHGILRRDVPDLLDFPEQLLRYVDHLLLRNLLDGHSLTLVYSDSGEDRRRWQRLATDLRTATYPLFQSVILRLNNKPIKFCTYIIK